MYIRCRWDVGARSRPAQASLGQRCASHGTIGDNIYAVSGQLGPCPNPWSKVAERMFFCAAVFCSLHCFAVPVPWLWGPNPLTNGVDRRQGAGIGPPGGPGSTEPHQRLAGRLEKGTWIRLQVDFNRPFVLHRSPKCHVRACAMKNGSGCCRRWLYQPVAVSACDSNIWVLAAGPLNPSLYRYLHIYIYIYIYLYLYLSIYLSIYLSLSIDLSIPPSVYLSIHPSIQSAVAARLGHNKNTMSRLCCSFLCSDKLHYRLCTPYLTAVTACHSLPKGGPPAVSSMG